MEAEGGGLKELVLRWFTEKQAPLILNNGNFPDWFQGLASRKDAEDVLEDKALGTFLIRLSDKTIGYILSYRGQDRCRHFVISQNPKGQFVIGGDSQVFGSLLELIQHYKVSPIQPFGEFLTSTCSEEDTDLYDVVNSKKTSGVSVQALRTLWDQKKEDSGTKQRIQQQPRNGPLQVQVPVQVPALPPKFKNRKLTGTVSVDAAPPSQVLPPVPKRGMPLGFSLSGSLPETTPYPGETQTRSSRPQRPQTGPNPAPRDSFDPPDDLSQAEGRSQSLPYLASNASKEEDYSNHSGGLFLPPSSSANRVTCQTYSIHAPPGAPSHHLEEQDVRSNPLYQSSEALVGGPAQRGDGTYSEVPRDTSRLTDDTYELMPAEASSAHNNTYELMPAAASSAHNNTYELMPAEASSAHNNTYELMPAAASSAHNNMYESLEDMKDKKSTSTWGKSNVKWKNFLKK